MKKLKCVKIGRFCRETRIMRREQKDERKYKLLLQGKYQNATI